MKLINAKVFDTKYGFIAKTLSTNGAFISADDTTEVIDVTDCYIIPGLTDLHFHGCCGADFSDGDKDGLQKMANYQLSRGVTQICPAGMTLDVKDLEKICKVASAFGAEHAEGADLVGIQLEGPFLSEAKKGAQNGAYLQKPSVSLYKHLQELSSGLVKIIAVAPEIDGAFDFIKDVSKEVVISVAHTTANYDTAKKAFDLGARHLTHMFNAMNGFLHRDPGPVGAAADSECRVEIISDGIHIHPSVIRSMFKLFGRDKMLLISDSMRATGVEDGEYTLGGQDVTVKGKLATLADGTIAGSATDLMDCMLNAVSFGVSLSDAVMAAAVNPAKTLGIFDKVGSLDEGKLANFVILRPDLSLHSVVFHGRFVENKNADCN